MEKVLEPQNFGAGRLGKKLLHFALKEVKLFLAQSGLRGNSIPETQYPREADGFTAGLPN